VCFSSEVVFLSLRIRDVTVACFLSNTFDESKHAAHLCRLELNRIETFFEFMDVYPSPSAVFTLAFQHFKIGFQQCIDDGVDGVPTFSEEIQYFRKLAK